MPRSFISPDSKYHMSERPPKRPIFSNINNLEITKEVPIKKIKLEPETSELVFYVKFDLFWNVDF